MTYRQQAAQQVTEVPAKIKPSAGQSPEAHPFENGNADINTTGASSTLIEDYVKSKRKQTLASVSIFVFGSMAYLCLAFALNDTIRYEWFVLYLALITLTALRYWLLKYRVKRAWFGNNEYEATELLRFALKRHST